VRARHSRDTERRGVSDEEPRRGRVAHRLLRQLAVRGAALLLVLAGCVRPPPDPGPPIYPTLEPDPVFDPRPTGLADLRSIAAAASIALEVGPAPLVTTQGCAAGVLEGGGLHGGARCYRCTLAIAESRPGALHPLEVPLRTLADTLLAYPHSFLRVARIERIALCGKLVRDPDTEPSERIAGLAESGARRLMVGVGHADARHATATLHHEIFHLFDHATDPDGDHRRDLEWERLNPRGFRYGDPAWPGLDGFVSDYARTAVSEDKASVFEYMMGFPDELCARAVDDPRLMAKARLLLARIDAAVPPGLGAFARRKASCLTAAGS
jgi:hypothetical protein